MGSISDILAELREEFFSLPDSFARYSYLAELSALLDPPENIRREELRYRGCQSRVWLDARNEDGTCRLRGDSDTLIVRSVLYLFQILLDGQPTADVQKADFDLLAALHISEHFPPQRAVGIAGLLPEIKHRLAFDQPKDNIGSMIGHNKTGGG